jgi:hypothetical protein
MKPWLMERYVRSQLHFLGARDERTVAFDVGTVFERSLLTAS